ncbi:hypothetical protein CHS0354_008513 [Potamilus streckersoni]|uniref:CARD domain-containing protein n=1 Tax=Potamilus streckersoni TaxID=2493646 RepID=A0AAE0S7Y9_9BIVA|nr:hypothetical protein CHS0354_008513 [Potamilus streckersoni]
MDPKEKRALDRCLDDLLKDFDPTPAFLHALCSENVITEEMMDKIMRLPARETQVSALIRCLQKRGPQAFTIFKNKLEQDYSWLSKKLEDELKKLQSGQNSINRRLINVIEHQLVPLIKIPQQRGLSGDSNNSDLQHPGVIIQYLNDLLIQLHTQCNKVLRNTVNSQEDRQPLCVLIEQSLQDMKQNAVEEGLTDLSKEVKDLRKQLKDVLKYKTENDKLKVIISKQKEKLKELAKLQKEEKRHKLEKQKIIHENEQLKFEIMNLKEQIQSNIASLYT